jgi:hypothetical protein
MQIIPAMRQKSSFLIWQTNDLFLFAISLAVSFLSKGQSLLGGLAIDDYRYVSGFSKEALTLTLSQGRFFSWIIYSLVDNLQIGPANAYFAATIFVLILQSALVVTVIRFISYTNIFYAGTVACLMTAHPYSAEILTFKVSAIGNAFALVAVITAIETTRSINRKRTTWFAPIIATTIALSTYQVMINVLLAATFGAMLMDQLINSGQHEHDGETTSTWRLSRKLLTVSFVGSMFSLLIMFIPKWTNQIGELTGRSQVISSNQVFERIGEVWKTFTHMLYKQEPIFPVLPKILLLMLLVLSLCLIYKQLIFGAHKLKSLVSFSGLIVLLPLLSLGVIIPFGDWWPVPRVLSHNSFLLGSFILVAEMPILRLSKSGFKRLFLTVGVVVAVMFVLISNQVFSDQLRVNRWDTAKAQRITSRLEELPEFTSVRRLHIDGGYWRYPLGPSSIQGDMNVSALFANWSKIGLINEATGYSFESSTPEEAALASDLCVDTKHWPDPGSVFIRGELGVVCL